MLNNHDDLLALVESFVRNLDEAQKNGVPCVVYQDSDLANKARELAPKAPQETTPPTLADRIADFVNTQEMTELADAVFEMEQAKIRFQDARESAYAQLDNLRQEPGMLSLAAEEIEDALAILDTEEPTEEKAKAFLTHMGLAVEYAQGEYAQA